MSAETSPSPGIQTSKSLTISHPQKETDASWKPPKKVFGALECPPKKMPKDIIAIDPRAGVTCFFEPPWKKSYTPEVTKMVVNRLDDDKA